MCAMTIPAEPTYNHRIPTKIKMGGGPQKRPSPEKRLTPDARALSYKTQESP